MKTPSLQRRRGSSALAWGPLLLSGAFLAIWCLGSSQAVLAIGTRMKTNTALAAFVLSVAAVLFVGRQSGRAAQARRGLAVVGALIGGLTLAQFLFGWELGIDQLFANGVITEETRNHPNRMAPQSALGFLLLGIGLAVVERNGRRRPWGEAFLLMTAALAFMSLLGHLYHAASLYKVPSTIRISVETAGCLLALSIATLGRLGRSSVLGRLRAETLGALMARRLMGVALLGPVFLGWLYLHASTKGWVAPDAAVPWLILSLVVVLAVLILVNARSVDALDRARREVESQLREAVAAREEFIALASHELKTPLTSMKLNLHSLKRSLEQAGAPAAERPVAERENVKRPLASFGRQVDRLNRLVEDMLDVGRVHAGKMRLERTEVALDRVLAGSLERVTADAHKAGVGVEVDVPEGLVGTWDAERLEQVFTNLLSNALKYGDGKPVRVTARQRGSLVQLSVKDQGIGIAAENLERVFKRFERAAPSSAPSGLGLGLYIARSLVESHGGRLQVESVPGQGSTFTVELPLHRSFGEVAVTPEPSTQAERTGYCPPPHASFSPVRLALRRDSSSE